MGTIVRLMKPRNASSRGDLRLVCESESSSCSSDRTRRLLRLVLDVPIQSKLGRVEDVPVTNLDAREEVVLGRSSLRSLTLA